MYELTDELAQYSDADPSVDLTGTRFGRVSDLHFGLVTLHDRVSVTAESKHRHEYHVALLLQKASSMACRMVKCTSETRPNVEKPTRFFVRERVDTSQASAGDTHACGPIVRVIYVAFGARSC